MTSKTILNISRNIATDSLLITIAAIVMIIIIL